MDLGYESDCWEYCDGDDDGDSRTDDADLWEYFEDDIDLEIPRKDLQNAYNRQTIQWEVGTKTRNAAMILENWMTLMMDKESNILVSLEENFSASAHGSKYKKKV